MNTATIKKLAYLTIEQQDVSDAVRQFAETRMTRANRKEFLFFLKQARRRRQVYVRLAGAPDASLTRVIADRYPGTAIQYESMPELGGGLQIERDDMIVDISFRRMVETLFKRIQES